MTYHFSVELRLNGARKQLQLLASNKELSDGNANLTTNSSQLFNNEMLFDIVIFHQMKCTQYLNCIVRTFLRGVCRRARFIPGSFAIHSYSVLLSHDIDPSAYLNICSEYDARIPCHYNQYLSLSKSQTSLFDKILLVLAILSCPTLTFVLLSIDSFNFPSDRPVAGQVVDLLFTDPIVGSLGRACHLECWDSLALCISKHRNKEVSPHRDKRLGNCPISIASYCPLIYFIVLDRW